METNAPNPHDDLIAEIEAFCATRNMALTRFGSEAVNDPAFVASLRNGRECRRATLARVRAYIDQVAAE